MQQIRKFFLPVLLMLVGILCRIVAGAVPFPPESPFSSPEMHMVAHSSDSAHSTPSEATTFRAAKTGKTHSEHFSTTPRPWHSLTVTSVNGSPTLFLSLFSPENAQIPVHLPLDSHLRPPSC